MATVTLPNGSRSGASTNVNRSNGTLKVLHLSHGFAPARLFGCFFYTCPLRNNMYHTLRLMTLVSVPALNHRRYLDNIAPYMFAPLPGGSNYQSSGTLRVVGDAHSCIDDFNGQTNKCRAWRSNDLEPWYESSFHVCFPQSLRETCGQTQ